MVDKENSEKPEIIRLNKYVAHAGVCSRRQAVEEIKAGHVRVNDQLPENPFIEINTEQDVVTYKGKRILIESKKVYVLLNKPKATVTTRSDEKGRRTVMDLMGEEIKERIYPVGRLDRETTGLLLLTNDGNLAQRLTHPSFNVSKVYEVTLDRAITDAQLEMVRTGLELEDGPIKPDAVHRIAKGSDKQVSIELHSGRNRIVRRIFEHLDFRVVHLDRVYYAGLTKKNIPRGRYRHLKANEIRNLKHLSL